MSRQQNIQLTVDAVVFGYTKARGLSVLLVKRKYEPFKGHWAMPGGFVNEGESLEEAVARELKEETSIEVGYLEQLYTFGKPDRDPRQHIVAVAYFALVRPDYLTIEPDTDAEEVAWFPIDEVPPLAFDHEDILQAGVDRVRGKLTYEPIGFELLDEKFPFSELEHLYRSLLGRELNMERRNFKKKFMSLGILEELDEYRKHLGSGRPARLYRFKPDAYFNHKRGKRMGLDI
jgi:8-oxo-dGTP diphosphatase